jgi:hypothetical protein
MSLIPAYQPKDGTIRTGNNGPWETKKNKNVVERGLDSAVNEVNMYFRPTDTGIGTMESGFSYDRRQIMERAGFGK